MSSPKNARGRPLNKRTVANPKIVKHTHNPNFNRERENNDHTPC
jgi:hypothetical protein